MPFPIFSGLSIKIPNLYHMPEFSIESVKETDLCCFNGKGRKQTSPLTFPELQHLRESVLCLYVFGANIRSLILMYPTSLYIVLQFILEFTDLNWWYSSFNSLQSDYFIQAFKTDLSYSKHLAPEANYIQKELLLC